MRPGTSLPRCVTCRAPLTRLGQRLVCAHPACPAVGVDQREPDLLTEPSTSTAGATIPSEVTGTPAATLDDAARLRLQLQLYVHQTLAHVLAGVAAGQREQASKLQARLGEERTLG